MEDLAQVVRGEVWWAATRGGDRPVLVLTRNPVADSASSVVVAACTSTIRGLESEFLLGPEEGMPQECVVSFDNLYTLSRSEFRRPITRLAPELMDEVCQTLGRALGCL